MPVILLLIFCHCCPLFSQDNKLLANYYQSLFAAEDYILISKYDSAVSYYEKAFSMYPDNFIPDLNNALICAIESDKYELTGKYITELLKRGVPGSYFEKKYYFKQFVGTQLFAALDEPFVSHIDSNKIKLIDSLLVLDQEPRINNTYELMWGVDSVNEKILERDIFNSGIIPGSDEIGVRMYNDTTIDSPPLDIIMIHMVKKDPVKYSRIYKSHLESHKISPLQYFSKAQIFTERSDTTNLGCDESMFATIQFIGEDGFTCCCELKDRINQNRKKFYLEDIDRSIRKYRFSKTASLPFMMQKHLYGKWEHYDMQKQLDAKNKKLSDPDFVRFIED